MKRRIICLFAALPGLVLVAGFSPVSESLLVAQETARAAEQHDSIDVPTLVRHLGSPLYQRRLAAQQSLLTLGSSRVAALREAREAATDPEIRWRLQQAIVANSRPRWLADVEVARRQAVESGKLLMVFSTIGEINGFS